MRTEQEAFWAGEFGDDYIARNPEAPEIAANLRLFTQALKVAGEVRSVVELGANVGLNLEALKLLYPGIHCSAVEINSKAAAQLRTKIDRVIENSILDWQPDFTADLALIKGVLIHINPEQLNAVYDRLYAASTRLILVCEYYNPTPVEVPYRGHSERLFKRDFAGEMIDRFNLRLLDYGFTYRRDPSAAFDDINWFLLEKP
jgi:spore coat polysaccharide biosynthesis protein SpsF